MSIYIIMLELSSFLLIKRCLPMYGRLSNKKPSKQQNVHLLRAFRYYDDTMNSSKMKNIRYYFPLPFRLLLVFDLFWHFESGQIIETCFVSMCVHIHTAHIYTHICLLQIQQNMTAFILSKHLFFVSWINI